MNRIRNAALAAVVATASLLALGGCGGHTHTTHYHSTPIATHHVVTHHVVTHHVVVHHVTAKRRK